MAGRGRGKMLDVVKERLNKLRKELEEHDRVDYQRIDHREYLCAEIRDAEAAIRMLEKVRPA